MTRFADVRTEWRVDAIESRLRDKADSHEIASLQREVDRLESSMRGANQKIEDLCNSLEVAIQSINELKQKLEEIADEHQTI